MSKNSKLWAILQFKPNAYKLAERNLQKQGYETFLPLQSATKHRDQKFLPAQRPLFPGYMFIAFEKKNMPWHKINHTYGVTKVLTSNNQPYVVPEDIIVKMKKQCNKYGVLLSQQKFSKDDPVRLVSGPFDKFLATVVSMDKNQRVWVLIDLMGQETRASVKPENLKYATK